MASVSDFHEIATPLGPPAVCRARASYGGMSARVARGARPQSLFYRDLGLSPVAHSISPGAGGEVGTPNQVTAALWRDTDGGGLNPPPPPFYTLEDRLERSPESNTNLTFETPTKFTEKNVSFGRAFFFSPSPIGSGGGLTLPSGEGRLLLQDASSSLSPPPVSGTSSWWSPLRERRADSGEPLDREGSGPGAGVAQQQQSGGLLTLPMAGDIVRPEFRGPSAMEEGAENDKWVTVFGFGVDETNSVMREFEKCGRIIGHVSGPGGANWVYLQYSTCYDAQKALQKNGIQLNGALILGVKSLDLLQYQALTQKGKVTGSLFAPLPLQTPTKGSATAAEPYTWSQYMQPSEMKGPALRSVLAVPAKSAFSKLVDLVFGM